MTANTQTHLFNASKKQFYGAEGTGRDTYISRDNGGFYPMTSAKQVEELGKHTFYNCFVWAQPLRKSAHLSKIE